MFRDTLKGALRFLFRKVILRPVIWQVNRKLRQFEAATRDPRRVQEAILRDILAAQAGTAFGRDHHFASVREVADFRRHVPVAGYEALEPYLARVLKGETSALLSEPRVHMFALTSGTTATRKFIPVTDRYLADYKRSWNIWGLRLYRDYRDTFLRPILQLVGDADEFRTETGVPCGAVTGLTARMQKRVIRRLYVAPGCLARVKDAPSKYYAAMRLALPRKVGLVVAANPSTILALARSADQHKEALIRDLRDGTLSPDLDLPPEVRAELAPRLGKHPERARELERVAERTGGLYPKDYWPDRFLLGNWTGGSVGAYLRHYPRYFGDAPVRDVGLIASEGRMTVPFADGTPAGVLDVTSHYFEFIPEAEAASPRPTVLGAHELAEGQRYFILLTTGYGLYRYHIHDLVRVAGFFNGTPLIEFLSKGAHFSNMTGEKLSEYQVTQAMQQVLPELGLAVGTYSVAPCWPDDENQPPWYGLFLEAGELPNGAGDRLARWLDERLCRLNIEYEGKRQSGRLAPLRVEPVAPGFWARWDRQRLERTRGALEQYKHPCLIGDLNFAREAARP
jgi:GH3 auxin-responsive promoter